MSYPQGAPGGPGYPPAQPPTNQFAVPTQQFGRAPEPSAAPGPSKLPMFLTAAVAVLGLLVYLSGFAPQFTIAATDFPGLGQLSGSSLGLLFAVISSILAALLAGVGLLPKQHNYVAVSAIAALLGFALVVAEVIKKPGSATIGWGLYLIIAFTLLQAAIAVVVLLFDAGVLTAPAPRPKYEQPQHYGPYPGQYYGAPQGAPQGAPPGQPQGQHSGGVPQQPARPGYPAPYGGGYPGSGQTTGGFAAVAPSGPPTPPTGFPTYGQPPASSAPTTQVATPHPPSSSQSDQSSS